MPVVVDRLQIVADSTDGGFFALMRPAYPPRAVPSTREQTEAEQHERPRDYRREARDRAGRNDGAFGAAHCRMKFASAGELGRGCAVIHL